MVQTNTKYLCPDMGILNVFAMYRMGFWWVLYPFPCDVLAVYLPGTPALAPGESGSSGLDGPSSSAVAQSRCEPTTSDLVVFGGCL